MFGKNPLRSPDQGPGRDLAVQSIFYTIQGEGPYAGMPAVFIRLAGCNLACTFCFVANTQITMADGSRRPISQVRKGDAVLTYDEKTGAFVPGLVTQTMTSSPRRLLRLMFTKHEISGNPSDKIICTPEHPLLVRSRGWVEAQHLRKGDVVLHLSNSERMRLFNPAGPREFTEAERLALSATMKETWKQPGFRTAHQQRMRESNPMTDPTVALRSHLARHDLNHMTSAETMFQKITEGLPIQFNAGQITPGNLAPDFFVEGQRKVIEVWAADALHVSTRNRRWRSRRQARMAVDGYDVLFLPIPPAGVRNGAYARIRQQVAEFIHNGEVFDRAEEIVPGDKSWVALAGSATSAITTYNLEVAGTHTYIANGKIVHNCDTEFESGMLNRMTIEQIVMRTTYERACVPSLVVLTGGEPLRQNIVPLIHALHEVGVNMVQLETAGTLWPKGLEAMFQTATPRVCIVCSPKTPKVHHLITAHCVHYKYVIQADRTSRDDGLPAYGTQAATLDNLQRIYRPERSDVTVWVSPCDDYDPVRNAENIRSASNAAMRFGHRLTLQLHKIVGLE